ncbi:MAG: glycosyltransferase family 29 protein [Marinosulfonomonas sp.]
MVSAVRFELAKVLRDEAWLSGLSVSLDALKGDLAGKRVALIGNSRALGQSSYGVQIDAADLVIRINRAPMPATQSHGTRTDWLALATTLPAADYSRVNPGRILWMSHKRKRLKRWIAERPGFYLHPLAEWSRLGQRLTGPPTTGAMMIDIVAKSDAASLDLYGFDFFASQSLSGSRTADQVPHDFGSEKGFVADLMAQDARVKLHK